MRATPATTGLGPEQALLRDLMRRLAEATSTDAPILSAYVDVRPEAHGEWPADVGELIVDETMPIDEDLRGELIRQAALTDAHVEIVREHPELARHDGVAATLRYRR
jgi:hypothetical protein